MTMSPVFMVFALIATSLCHNGDCSDKCLNPLPENQMLTTTNEKCFAGYYKKVGCQNSSQILCEKCGKEKFTAYNNIVSDCYPCSVCKSDQVAKSDCTNQKDRECVCRDGLFRIHMFSSEWRCENCTKCTNCSLCPECKGNCGAQNCGYGQFLDQKGKCQSCANHNCSNKSCKSFCKPVPVIITTTWILTLGITLSILVPLGLFPVCRFILVACRRSQLCCWAHEKNVHTQTLPGLPGEKLNILLPMDIIPGSAVKETGTRDNQRHLYLDLTGQITAPLIINGDIKELTKHEPENKMWPAQVLYTIIREVPVLRWKEFLRLLSLTDDQMERVELESRGSYLEKQYQMLRLWSQMNGACLENIYSTLHLMDLSGCAEKLQEKLQHLQEILV